MNEDERVYMMLRELRDTHVDIQKSLGRLEEGQKNVNDHISSVSNNVKSVDAKLDTHKDDLDAHGIKVVKRVFAGIATLIGALVGCIEAYHWLRGIGG